MVQHTCHHEGVVDCARTARGPLSRPGEKLIWGTPRVASRVAYV